MTWVTAAVGARPQGFEMIGRLAERYQTGPTWCMIALPIMMVALWGSTAKGNTSPRFALGITIMVTVIVLGYAPFSIVEALEPSVGQ